MPHFFSLFFLQTQHNEFSVLNVKAIYPLSSLHFFLLSQLFYLLLKIAKKKEYYLVAFGLENLIICKKNSHF